MCVVSKWVSFKQYCELVDCGSFCNVSMYHDPVWLEVVREGFNVEIKVMSTVRRDGKLLALTPYMVITKGPFHLYGSPLKGMYTEFSGPIYIMDISDDERFQILESQHQMLLRNAHYLEFGEKNGEGTLSGNALSQLGYEHTLRASILIEISIGKDNVWNNFQGRARNMIRKSIKSGVTAHSVTPTRRWVQNYYSMLSVTFKKQGRSMPHPLSFYQQLICLAEAGYVLCVSAEIDGRNISNAIFLIDKDSNRMLYLSGTANIEGMKLAASSLIQWHAICEAIAIGLNHYDMGGLGVASIDKFKRSFGGQEIFHHRWVYKSRLFGLIEPIALWAIGKGLIRMGRR
jgi:hypothetical protein